MKTDTQEILYCRSQIEGSTLGDEIVFFDDRVGKYFAVSPVGADIWKMLESPMSLNAIVANLVDQYEVDEDACRSETKAFLENLAALSLIHLA
jgi:TRAP-type uncharacterized transport system substrate-binding protein